MVVTALLAATLFVLIQPFASRVVRQTLAHNGAADRAALAAGDSPWHWHFTDKDDLVAGRAFGTGVLASSSAGLLLETVDDSVNQLGFPLARTVDLRRLDTLHLDIKASARGKYALLARQTLISPLLSADIGTLPAGPLPGTVRLDQLAWKGADGAPVALPPRLAMLRLTVQLPAQSTLTLREAWLAAGTGPVTTRGTPLPAGLPTEALLHWRDARYVNDPLATFGDLPPPASHWTGWPWIPLPIYLVLILVSGRRAHRRGSAGGADALLVLAGPLWLIAGMGLGPVLSIPGSLMFALGVAYAGALTWRRLIPEWHWSGAWRMAGWPLLAIPVAIGLVAVAGHPLAWPSPGRAALYIGWALFQQWLLLAVAGSLLDRAMPRPFAVLLTALAFALLHTPNGLLMQLCFVAELGWAWWYTYHRSLLPVALAHAAAAVMLQADLTGGILRSLEVSARYLM
ncbi:MAG: hypothetical protein GAK28_02218 [Luteibacter sp.]|nr:MAG: hypothetical protein GAK28_02218 [Luteibacter sp.]